MAQLKDLIVSGPTRLLNDLYVQNSIQVTTGIKIGSANELKSFGTGLSINSSGVLSCTVTGTITGSGTNGYLTKWNGGSSITNGPQLGSDTTKFLNNAGGWTVPVGTTYSAGTGLTLSGTAFSLNTASTSALGGIKVGEGLAINSGNGLLSIDSTGADEGEYLRRGTDGFEWGVPTKLAAVSASSVITDPGTGKLGYYYSIGKDTTGLFPATDAANAILTIHRYSNTSSNYCSQLGFSNSAMYFRTFGNTALNTNTSWNKVITGGTIANTLKMTNGSLDINYSDGLSNTGTDGALVVNFAGSGSATTASRSDHTHANMVTGSGLTANEFVMGNGSSSIKTATVATVQTKLGLGSLAYVSPSTSGTGTTLFLGYSQDDGTYSLMDPSSDHLVTQVNSSSNVAYRVLLSYSDSNSTQVNFTYKNSGLTFNPSTGILNSAKIETGSAATSYFQSQRFRGEGDAATYFHAVDFGYAGHNRVDFYEYGGIYCFHQHTASAVGSGDTVLGTITANGWEGNVVGNVTGTASGNALASHTHGYITNIGALGSNASVSSVATGDALVIVDASDSSKISYLGATLNTTHGGSFLRRDGTWAVPPATSGVTAIRQNNGSGTEYTNVKLTFSGATINMSNNVVLVTIDGTCLMEGTKILMADRTEKNVEDVVEGDLIMSYDPNTGEMCEAIVIANLGTGVSDDFVNYYFDDGSFVTIFGKHCLYNSDMGTARGVDFWEPGWKCINSSGEEITYIGSEDITHVGRKRHFDLRSSNMLYFANGVLNANALTANNMLVKRSGFEFPQSYLDAIQEDADSSARLNTFKFDKTIGSRLVPILKEMREQKKILDDNKKLLADTDYIVAKFTEGLISTVEWLKAKADRAGWRTLVNKAEEAYNTAKTRYDAFKDQYKPTSTHRERFNAAVARDNACLDVLKAYYKSKNDLPK